MKRHNPYLVLQSCWKFIRYLAGPEARESDKEIKAILFSMSIHDIILPTIRIISKRQQCQSASDMARSLMTEGLADLDVLNQVFHHLLSRLHECDDLSVLRRALYSGLLELITLSIPDSNALEVAAKYRSSPDRLWQNLGFNCTLQHLLIPFLIHASIMRPIRESMDRFSVTAVARYRHLIGPERLDGTGTLFKAFHGEFMRCLDVFLRSEPARAGGVKCGWRDVRSH